MPQLVNCTAPQSTHVYLPYQQKQKKKYRKYIIQIYTKLTKIHKYASYPDWRISPHAGHHHQRVCHTWLYETYVTNIVHVLALVLKPGPKFTKGEMTYYPPKSIILPNFIALCQPMPDISITKNLLDGQK